MSDHTFKYPTATAPTSTLTFNTKARLVSDPDTLQFNDDLGTTKGGTDRVLEYGDNQNHYAFSFMFPRSHASLTDLADVKTFFGVVKRLYTFVWTDDVGTARTVRIITNPIRFEPIATGLYYQCTLELREQ